MLDVRIQDLQACLILPPKTGGRISQGNTSGNWPKQEQKKANGHVLLCPSQLSEDSCSTAEESLET